MIPDDATILADLTAPRWKPTTGGILIESKEDLEKRIHRSPDEGEAIILSLAPWVDKVGLVELGPSPLKGYRG